MADITLKHESSISGFEIRGNTLTVRSDETYSKDGEVLVRQEDRGWKVRRSAIADDIFTLPSGANISGAEFIELAMNVAAAVKTKAERAETRKGANV